MLGNYDIRNYGTSPFITKSVIDRAFRTTQGRAMLTAEIIRAELVRQLDAKRFTAKKVAGILGVGEARITEMRKGTRRVQQHEMAPLAEFLEMVGDIEQDAPTLMLPVQLPSADRLTAMMHGMLRAVGFDDQAAGEHAETLALRLPVALARAAGPQEMMATDEATTRGGKALSRATPDRAPTQ